MHASADSQTTDDILQGMPKLAWRMFCVFGILAVLSIAIYAFGAVYGDRLAKVGHSSEIKPLEIIISNDAYSIPQNMIRHADQRVGGVADRIDLSVQWPSQSGYTDSLAAQFSDSNPDTIELVFMTLSKRNSLLDMAERFVPVYHSAIETDKIKTLSNGLYIAPLIADYGYVNERLVYSRNDASGTPKFVARCQATIQGESRLLLPCETDIFVGETTQMKIRFAVGQLQRWELFSKELKQFTDKLLVSN